MVFKSNEEEIESEVKGRLKSDLQPLRNLIINQSAMKLNSTI